MIYLLLDGLGGIRMAADQRKRSEITSADTKAAGFEYQYLYFIVKLLELNKGEAVGYEDLDDVHKISLQDNETYFYQVKHTVQTAAKGEQPNLTTYSDDLWKTLSNWSKLIIDKAEGRSSKVKQKEFIENSHFILVLNRKLHKNDIVDIVFQFQNKEIKIAQVNDRFKELHDNTTDEKIKEYINDVIKIGSSVLALFIQHIAFINSDNDLFEMVRDGIRNKMISEEDVEDVMGKLYLQLKIDFFDKVQSGKHQIITYDVWQQKYNCIFNEHKKTQLPLRRYTPMLPEHLEQQQFVQELIDIGAVENDIEGLAEIAEFTDYYLQSVLQLDDWHQEGRVSFFTIQQFHEESEKRWKNLHRTSHRSTKADISVDSLNALKCFDTILNEKLTLLSTDLGITMSNGEFIRLAEEMKIGWKYYWKVRYQSNGDKYIKE